MHGKTRFILLVLIVFADSAAQGQTPPPPSGSSYAPQNKPGSDQPQQVPTDLNRAPDVALETNAHGSEGRLDFSDHRLPQAPEMLGDVPPPVISVVPVVIQLPPHFVQLKTRVGKEVFTRSVLVPGNTVVIPGAALPCSGRGFKIADDGSARPIDRVFLDFNFFSDLLAASNLRLGTDIHNLNLYRESLGLEKTLLNGTASIGLHLPLDTVTLESSLPNLNGTHTAPGDLTVFGKYALFWDPERDNWLTAGLALTVPTGPSAIAGLDAPTISHSTVFQPYLAALWNLGDFYLHGFFSVDTPTDSRDVTLLYSDLGLGYFLYRTRDWSRFLTGLAPTVEIHSSNPVNHRGPPSLQNPLTSFDLVDVGLGVNLQFRGLYWLALEAVTPLTGPRPFTIEALAQFRIRF